MFSLFSKFDHAIRQYILVTFNYWNFTITDGALRMLIVLYFYDLGYSTLSIASLFLFYEFFGVVTNLIGGWLGARLGLNRTMNIGLGVQIIALLLLILPEQWLSIPLVMLAQALSGIAKDLNKMSAKSAIKSLVPKGENQALYKWVAILTGSKNALKGVGFFIGGALLTTVGFQSAITIMAFVLSLVFILSILTLESNLGKAKTKPKFSEIFSKSANINILSAARLFLFGSRDVWFVVALPIYLGSVFQWEHSAVGGFLALWVIGYGVMQSIAPKITGASPDGRSALLWVLLLSAITACIAYAVQTQWHPEFVIVIGLMIFGIVFAINSSLHSYLIVHYAGEDGVSLDVGFYYMANAMGRLVGTILSGWVFQIAGLAACMWVSFGFLLLTCIISIWLPKSKDTMTQNS